MDSAADLTIERDEVLVKGDWVTVLTRFLGMDHKLYAHGEGFALPLIFETGIFGLHEHIDRHRYSSYDEAVTGHAGIIGQLLVLPERAAQRAERT